MRVFIWLTFFMTLSFVSGTAQIQTATKDKKATGSISGKVTVDGESDSPGEFRVDKFTPGKYTISVWQYEDKTWYSDNVAFEVYGSDVSGIEIKAYRTASVSGVVMVENTSNPQVLAQLSKLKITFLT